MCFAFYWILDVICIHNAHSKVTKNDYVNDYDALEIQFLQEVNIEDKGNESFLMTQCNYIYFPMYFCIQSLTHTSIFFPLKMTCTNVLEYCFLDSLVQARKH